MEEEERVSGLRLLINTSRIAKVIRNTLTKKRREEQISRWSIRHHIEEEELVGLKKVQNF